jgi:hypothetical protein
MEITAAPFEFDCVNIATVRIHKYTQPHTIHIFYKHFISIQNYIDCIINANKVFIIQSM